MKKLLSTIFVIIAVLTLCACGEVGSGDGADFDFAEYEKLYRDVIASQESYLKSLQLENGAFVKWTDARSGSNEVVPYFACFVGLALLENEDNLPLVKKYIDWHFSALNRADDYNGIAYTIYDYTVNDGEMISTDSYDSTDSYAALFLILLDKYAATTDGTAFIAEKSSDILNVAAAMVSTMHNGLTAAKPDYAVSYTMDNSEVYSGLKAAERLMLRVENSVAALRFAAEAVDLQAQIESRFYSKILKHYKPYAETLFLNTDIFYPDGAAQIYPAMFGVTDAASDRSQQLMDELIENYSNTVYRTQIDFPWLIIAYAAVLLGKYAFATEYLQENYDKYMEYNAYPWYSMEGAAAYLTASRLLSLTH